MWYIYTLKEQKHPYLAGDRAIRVENSGKRLCVCLFAAKRLQIDYRNALSRNMIAYLGSLSFMYKLSPGSPGLAKQWYLLCLLPS